MPFPLPLDSYFRKEVVWIWLCDIADRIELGDLEGARQSWKTAQAIYLTLPPGSGSEHIEQELVRTRVKLDSFTQQPLCEQLQMTLQNQ